MIESNSTGNGENDWMGDFIYRTNIGFEGFNIANF